MNSILLLISTFKYQSSSTLVNGAVSPVAVINITSSPLHTTLLPFATRASILTGSVQSHRGLWISPGLCPWSKVHASQQHTLRYHIHRVIDCICQRGTMLVYSVYVMYIPSHVENWEYLQFAYTTWRRCSPPRWAFATVVLQSWSVQGHQMHDFFIHNHDQRFFTCRKEN